MSTSSWASPQHLGKYELQERLGHGAAAEVWKAFDTKLHRYVAIKLLHADLRTDPEFMARFSREALFIAALHHPNIVQIYDFQTMQSPETHAPIAYMVMDYIKGETLAHYIQTTWHAGKLPDPTEIVHLFASISKAIDYAHQEGMIHRDIKPANILLDKRYTAPHSIGEPVLTDFGIAKIVGTGADTMNGTLLGTPLYISPEQAQGYPGTKLSDIYALGIILYEICTGVCPFRGENATAIMVQQINSAPLPPALINPAIPPALTAVILHAMAKDPAERFNSASALTLAIAEAFHLPHPTDLLLLTHPSNGLPGLTYLSTRPSDSSPSIVLPGTQPPQPSLVTKPLAQPSPMTKSLAQPSPVTKPLAQPSPLASANPLPTLISPSPVRLRRTWQGNLIVWVMVLLVLTSSTVALLIVLGNGNTNPATTAETTLETLTLTNSGQYDPNTTVGYNDIITLSLHNLTTPHSGNAYFAWLMPDQGDDTTPPLLLGHLSVNAGNTTLMYNSPTHTNLLAQYSGVRITEQSANNPPTTPSLDDKTWILQGWIPHIPAPGDPKHYSLVDHLRHLIAKDPTLQANSISGGLVIWMTRNVGKVEEWCSAAQGSWGDGDADLIRRHMLRILDYIDGQTYVGLDVPSGSPWLVDPLGGKLGLLSYNQGQIPPGYLQHVDIHLMGLISSPGHTDEQKQVATQVDSVIQRMITDLTQVRKDTIQLVQRNNDQLLQPDTLALLNDMATLTTEVNSGWLDQKTHETVGGAIWLHARLQQLATISLTAQKLQ